MRDEDLKEIFSYDAKTGVITRLVSPNPEFAGKQTGFRKRDGYIGVSVGKTEWPAHRLAWFLHFGVWPDGQLDHKNRKRDDNRLGNLRLATRQQNSGNQPGRGRWLKGVTFYGGSFRAQIKRNGRNIHLGVFDTEQAAHVAYCAAAAVVFGEFASAA